MRNLVEANITRSINASARNIERAKKAMAVLSAIESPSPRRAATYRRYIAVLRMRINYPDATLAEIADLMRVTKDLYASRLRRALKYADLKEPKK